MLSKHQILEIASEINNYIQNNPKIFPTSWNVNAVVKKYTCNQFVENEWKSFEKDYIQLNHSDKINSADVYRTSDLFLPIEWGRYIG